MHFFFVDKQSGHSNCAEHSHLMLQVKIFISIHINNYFNSLLEKYVKEIFLNKVKNQSNHPPRELLIILMASSLTLRRPVAQWPGDKRTF